MEFRIEISNQTDFSVDGVEALLFDFLGQLNYAEDTEISLVFCDNDFINELNLKYRGFDKPTDVLSFPADMPGFLGDIVISIETAVAQAEQGAKEEVEMLLCHGLLHLLGYDHEQNDEDAEIMFTLQNKLLQNKKEDITLK